MTLALPQPIKNSSMGVMLSNISRAAVGVHEKADEIIRHVNLCTFVSFLTRYFLFRPSAQNTQPYAMIGRICSCVYPFHRRWFYSPRFPKIRVHCINAVVSLRVIRVICGLLVSKLACCQE